MSDTHQTYYMEAPATTQEIVILMRGFFATPIMSSLGRLGILKEMLRAGKFTVNDFTNIPNKKVLLDSFVYLTRLGLLACIDQKQKLYSINELGRQIFQRCSSFYVPHSYYKYLCHYHELLLQTEPSIKPEVERLENVIGSGETHLRYFPPAVSFLVRKAKIDAVVDVGCGDGHFLVSLLQRAQNKQIIGIDLSSLAIETTRSKIKKQYPHHKIDMICANAFDVETWAEEVIRHTGTGRIAFTMWFLIHEISNKSPDRVVQFLKNIHQLFPDSPIVICELVQHDTTTLAQQRMHSFMAEYLFFHDLSGQGILSWAEYQQVLATIPYTLVSERLFDELQGSDGEPVPSSFVWCLVPKNA